MGNRVRALVSLLFVAAVAGGGEGAAAGEVSPEAESVLRSTKTTTATYSLYIWNRITKPQEVPVEEGAVEFHAGDLHRVETPRDRLIADCRKMTGTYLSVETGKLIEGPQVAHATCGINTNSEILSAEVEGEVRTRLGKAKRIRITDAQNIRVYDVSEDGVLLRSTYQENRPNGAVLIVAEGVRLDKSVPDPAMFDRASLERSYFPERLDK